jgi:hypothetical protein
LPSAIKIAHRLAEPQVNGILLGISNYFMIAIFPIQANYLIWSWDRLAAIALFAAPAWFLLHFGLMPMRKGRR